MQAKLRNRYHAEGVESEFESGSRGRVLRNRQQIVRVRDMQAAESEALLRVQDWALDHFTDRHRFTSGDIRHLHRQWLGELYEWAGEYRSVNMSKGNLTFAAAMQVPRLMEAFERQELAECTPCFGFDTSSLVRALARTHAELVIIHPFREGNGRCARLIATLMALQAGFPPLDFSPLTGRGRAIYFAAIRGAFAKNYAPLETSFSRVLARTLRGHEQR
jgi:cell filamentation protein